MPIRYYGIRSKLWGRPLWEIVFNLKNLGKGRYIIPLSVNEKFPEPTFYKILSVHPHVMEYPENMYGNLFVEVVWRGHLKHSPKDLGPEAVSSDYALVHKDEEGPLFQKLKEYQAKPTETTVLPRTAPLPPLWKELFLRDKSTGQTPEEVPVIHQLDEDDPLFRVADDKEKPSFQMGPGHFNPVHKSLYDGVIWNREEARAYYCNRPPHYEWSNYDKFRKWPEINKLRGLYYK